MTAVAPEQPLEVLIGPRPRRNAGAVRVLVVDPMPEERSDGASPAETLRAAFAAPDAPARYTRYNAPGVGSCRAPTGLKSLYPGLTPRNACSPERVGLSDILKRAGSAEIGAIEADVPGEERWLLESVRADLPRLRLCTIRFWGSETALFDTSMTGSSVAKALSEMGFVVAETRPSDDGDWSIWTVSPDYPAEARGLRRELRALTTAAEARAAELDRASADLSRTLRLLGAREADLDDLRERHATLLERCERQDALLSRLASQLSSIEEVLEGSVSGAMAGEQLLEPQDAPPRLARPARDAP